MARTSRTRGMASNLPGHRRGRMVRGRAGARARRSTRGDGGRMGRGGAPAHPPGGAGAGVLFHRSGLSSIPGSWDGWIQTYKIEQRAGVPLPGARWRPDGAARKITEPAPSTRCITVKKVVTNVRDDRNAFSGSATHSSGAWRFTGLRETAPGRSWGPTFYSTFTVSEDVSPGYFLQGYLAIRGLDASCPADPPESRLKRLPITFVISAANPAMTVCVYSRRSAVA